MITKHLLQRIIAAWSITIFIVLSTLNAQTWTSLQGPHKARNVNDMTWITNGTTLYAADKTEIFKSTNSAVSWTATVDRVIAPQYVVCKPDNADVVVVCTSNYIYKSLNGGTTFYPICATGSLPFRLSVSSITLQTDNMFLGRQAYSTSSCILRSTNAGTNWSIPTTYPTGTNIKDIAPYPTATDNRLTHVWAVGSDPNNSAEGTPTTTRGIWQSTDLGANWTYKDAMRDKNVTSIAIKPSGPPDLWVGTNGGEVYFSNDEGASWDLMKNNLSSIRAVRTRHNSGTWEVYVATSSTLHKTTNNGTDWSEVTAPAGMVNLRSFNVVSGSSNQSTMYISADNGVWKTTDGGGSWDPKNEGLGFTSISSATGNSTNYWTVMKDQDTVSWYNGSSWANQEISDLYPNSVMRHSSIGYLYLPGAITQHATLYRSTDGGENYYSVYTSGSQGTGYTFKGAMVNPQDNTYLYVWGKDGSTANFYNIADYGAGTREPYTVSGSASNTVNDVAVTGTQTIYYGLDNVGVYKSTAGPSNGTQILSSVTIRSLAANPNIANYVYAAGPSGFKKTTNGGSSWSNITNMNLKRVILSPGFTSSTSNLLFLTNDGLHLYYSANSGSSWSQVNGNLPTPIYDISAVTGNPSAIYVSTECGLYQMTSPTTAPTLASPNNSATVGAVPTLSWNSVSGVSTYHLQIASDENFNTIVVDAKEVASTSYNATALDLGTYYWKVASTNYVGQSDYSSSRSFTTALGDSITLTVSSYLGGDGYFHPRLSWTRAGQGSNFYIYSYTCACNVGDCRSGDWLLPLMATTTDSFYNDEGTILQTKGLECANTIYYQIRSNGVSRRIGKNTAMGEEQKIAINDGLPKRTRLKGNYPNPFNPTTHITYDLHQDALVTLVVYDLLGREVHRLINEFQSAGSKEVTFNASGLPSGVYFYRFTAGKYTAIQKFILAK